MEKVRLIIQSSANGEQEAVIFTHGFDESVEDFLLPGYTIDHDIVIEDNLPTSFPREYSLKRS